MTLEQWQQVISTNVDSLFTMTRPVWEGMRERKFGRVISISSINGQKGQFGQTNYAAAKAGAIGFTKALAQEGAAAGSRSTASARATSRPRWSRRCRQEVLKSKILPQIPVGRLGEPEEIARCVAFLASDEAGFITGSTLPPMAASTWPDRDRAARARVRRRAEPREIPEQTRRSVPCGCRGPAALPPHRDPHGPPSPPVRVLHPAGA